MNATDKIDAARIDLLLGELRLPGIKLIWTALAQTADKEGWPAARFLAAHTPTRRELPHVVRIAGRLRRGEDLFEE